MNGIVRRLEAFLFGRRVAALAVIGVLTAVMAYFALQLRMEAGFEKQMPIGHEYIQTFRKYRDDLFGANRLTVVVKPRQGSIWTKPALTRLYDVTQAVLFLPNIDRLGVQSLWTPNSFVNEITEEGFRAEPLIDGTISPPALTDDVIVRIRRSTSDGGFVGTLVSRDQASAMITAELDEYDRAGNKLDYVAYNRLLDEKLRGKFEDKDFEIQIIGFAKQVGDIADGAASVLVFCAIALVLTALAVFWYCHSVRFTLLPIACSLTSLVWQFGTLQLLGFGLDPLAVLVPFLVFAIGVSHGVQQINYITRELAHGCTAMQAARHSFTGLLVPGTLALVTAFVSFVTLVIVPIPMVRELAITASIGVAYKIVTNLVMLPLAASWCNVSKAYAERALACHEARSRRLRTLAAVAHPRNAMIATVLTVVLLGVSMVEGRDRVIGSVAPGAPELRAEARFNRDATSIAASYDIGLDWLTVVFEAAPESCGNVAIGAYQDDFAWAMQEVPGVISISGFSSLMRTYNLGYNEGNPKMSAVPLDSGNYAALATEIGRMRGYMRKDCSMTAVHLFLADHKATTISGVIRAVEQFRHANPRQDVQIRLASGNAGVLAAINDEVERSEQPMLLYVYATIMVLVLLAYRDLRAVIACCLPLTVATFVGYWFMKALQIGLTVATLPVMVLAVGIGVDYAFYIYNRLHAHMAQGQGIVQAMEGALLEVGMATIFTAITLAIGVSTWTFSALKFQADMGKLLAFMFLVNLVMAMTALPALAVVLERAFPRRRAVRASKLMSH